MNVSVIDFDLILMKSITLLPNFPIDHFLFHKHEKTIISGSDTIASINLVSSYTSPRRSVPGNFIECLWPIVFDITNGIITECHILHVISVNAVDVNCCFSII